MEIQFEENEKFKLLMSGGFLNAQTTGAFMKEALKETVGPGSIAHQHFMTGQGTWPQNQTSTLKKKRDGRVFVQSGRVLGAITQTPSGGKLMDWGSSADIYSGSRVKNDRWVSGGLYAKLSVGKNKSSLTIGFNGRYKHSRGFNSERRNLAKKKTGLTRGLNTRTVQRAVSVGEVERRLRSINADRRARGMKTIRKWEAKGALGIRGNKMELARGGDNLAYADIVQRGKFRGLTDHRGTLFSPKGVASRRRSGMITEGKATFGAARPLLPYKVSDEGRIGKALDRALAGLAFEMNK